MQVQKELRTPICVAFPGDALQQPCADTCTVFTRDLGSERLATGPETEHVTEMAAPAWATPACDDMVGGLDGDGCLHCQLHRIPRQE